MKKRELSDDVLDIVEEPEPSEIVELLGKFNVGEYWERSFTFFHANNSNPHDTKSLMNYIQMLKQAGLDIGKGDYEFGYKMPVPEKDKSIRYLQIFRRR